MTDTDTKTVDGITQTFETEQDDSGIMQMNDTELEMLFMAHLDKLQMGLCPGLSRPLTGKEIVAKLERLLELAKHLKR